MKNRLFIAAILMGSLSPVLRGGEEIPKLSNPSFEKGSGSSVPGWTIYSGEGEHKGLSARIVESGATDGSQAIELIAGPGSVANQWILQDIAVTEQTMKRLLVRVQAKGMGQGQVHMLFYGAATPEEEAKGGVSSGNSAEVKFSVTEEYLPFELNLEIPPGTVRMRLHLGALAPGSAITFARVEILASPAGKEPVRPPIKPKK